MMCSYRTINPKQIVLSFFLLFMTGQVQAERQKDQLLLFCEGKGRCAYETYNISRQAALLSDLLRKWSRVINIDRLESAEKTNLTNSIRNLENALNNGSPSDIHDAMAATFSPASKLNKIIQDDSDYWSDIVWSDIKAQYIIAAQANAKEKAGWDYGWDGYNAAQNVRKEAYRIYLDEQFPN